MPRRGRCGRPGRSRASSPTSTAGLADSGDNKVKIAVSIHAGRAAIGEIGSSEPPMLMAIGEAVDVANDLRKAAAERDKAFAISEKVYADAGLAPVHQDSITIRRGTGDNGVSRRCGADAVAELDAARRARPPRHAPAAMGGRLGRPCTHKDAMSALPDRKADIADVRKCANRAVRTAAGEPRPIRSPRRRGQAASAAR